MGFAVAVFKQLSGAYHGLKQSNNRNKEEGGL